MLIREIDAYQAVRGMERVIKLKEVHETDASIFLVFDRLKGADLLNFRGGQSYNEKEIKWILRELLSLLRDMKNRKIVHRNIKPENIFFANDDPYIFNNSLCLIEFGSSWMPPQDPSQDQTQGHGFVVDKKWEDSKIFGTVGYIAPEIFQNSPYTWKSDMYSIGVCIIQLMLGWNPFDINKGYKGNFKQNCKRIFERNKEGSINLSDYPQIRDFSPQLVDIVQRMVSCDPEDRPQPEALIRFPTLLLGEGRLDMIEEMGSQKEDEDDSEEEEEEAKDDEGVNVKMKNSDGDCNQIVRNFTPNIKDTEITREEEKKSMGQRRIVQEVISEANCEDQKNNTILKGSEENNNDNEIINNDEIDNNDNNQETINNNNDNQIDNIDNNQEIINNDNNNEKANINDNNQIDNNQENNKEDHKISNNNKIESKIEEPCMEMIEEVEVSRKPNPGSNHISIGSNLCVKSLEIDSAGNLQHPNQQQYKKSTSIEIMVQEADQQRLEKYIIYPKNMIFKIPQLHLNELDAFNLQIEKDNSLSVDSIRLPNDQNSKNQGPVDYTDLQLLNRYTEVRSLPPSDNSDPNIKSARSKSYHYLDRRDKRSNSPSMSQNSEIIRGELEDLMTWRRKEIDRKEKKRRMRKKKRFNLEEFIGC